MRFRRLAFLLGAVCWVACDGASCNRRTPATLRVEDAGPVERLPGLLPEFVVVDGNLNSFARTDPDCRTDCAHSIFGGGDFGSYKAVTGVDVAATTFTTQASQAKARSSIDSGAYESVVLIRTVADLEHAVGGGEFGQLMATQKRIAPDWQLRGDVSRLDEWHEDGLRILLLAYAANEGHGEDERLGYASDEGDEQGLTDLGRSAIARMNGLGMLVDVSHCNTATTLEAAATSSAPIVSTHANVRALVDVARNKTDAEIEAIAGTGGVFAVTAIQWMTTAGPDRATVDELIDHIDYVVQLVGVEHVGVSTDSWTDGWDNDSSHRPGDDLNASDRWVHVARRLAERGYSEVEIAAILGGNFLRVLRAALPPGG